MWSLILNWKDIKCVVVESTKFQDKHIYRKSSLWPMMKQSPQKSKIKWKTDKIWKRHELHIFLLKNCHSFSLWNEKEESIGIKCFPIRLKYLTLSKLKLIRIGFACSKWAEHSQVLSIFGPLFIDHKTIYPVYTPHKMSNGWFEKSILNFTYRIEMANSDLV